MRFASDNTSGAAPEIMAAVLRANDGFERSYGADPLTASVTALVRQVFEAPEAAVYLVATGTAANALSLALLTPPWAATFAHQNAHATLDECGAPEFYSGGAKVLSVAGDRGKMTPDTLAKALAGAVQGDVHSVQRGALTITNLTEAGTVYTPAEVATLTALAKAQGMACHMDGSRLANALVATGASPAEMTWKAGVDVLSLGGTKNGCLGVEAVVLFDPTRAWEFELRRKRGGHLFSKHRFLAAQMEAYLQGGLWLKLAAQANAMGQRLANGLRARGAVAPECPANMMFPEWAAGTHDRLAAAGAVYYPVPAPEGREAARLVTSWSTREAEVDRFLQAF
jgi:threonine aldolase